MTLAQIRRQIEVKVNDAFDAVGVPVVFDNVQEEPPAQTYVNVMISYSSFVEPTVAQIDSYVELIRGTVMLVIRCPRGGGMGTLEALSVVGMQALMSMKGLDQNPSIGMGEILGPTYLTAGDDPLIASNVSAGFRVVL